MNASDADDDELNERLFTQALPVAQLRKDVDLSVPPTTGDEYLSRVRYEASKCPDIVVAQIDVSKYKRKQTPQYPQQIATNENREEFRAAIEWQRERCAEFSILRLRIERERDEFKKQNLTALNNVKLPNTNNKNEWFTFCFGKHKKNSREMAMFEAHRPLLTFLYKMDQASIIQLFEYQVEWLLDELGGGYSRESFEWLYALMGFLEKPLLPETYSSMRTLARTCTQLRAELTSENDEKLVPFNLFISIIGRYFEQFDLADK